LVYTCTIQDVGIYPRFSQFINSQNAGQARKIYLVFEFFGIV